MTSEIAADGTKVHQKSVESHTRSSSERSEECEIRITGPGKTRNYIAHATELLTTGHTFIELKAMGQSINKTVRIAEIIKRRIPGLHQNNKISSISTQDTWEPVEDGLDSISIMVHVSVLCIVLSTEPLDVNDPGYQPPLSPELVKMHTMPPDITQQVATQCPQDGLSCEIWLSQRAQQRQIPTGNLPRTEYMTDSSKYRQSPRSQHADISHSIQTPFSSLGTPSCFKFGSLGSAPGQHQCTSDQLLNAASGIDLDHGFSFNRLNGYLNRPHESHEGIHPRGLSTVAVGLEKGSTNSSRRNISGHSVGDLALQLCSQSQLGGLHGASVYQCATAVPNVQRRLAHP